MTPFDYGSPTPTTARKPLTIRRRQPEAAEQAGLIYWARLNEAKCPALKMLFHIPNGGRRDAKTGAMLQRQGVKPGVPDLFLAYPTNLLHGLFVEMKAPGCKGDTSEAQDWWQGGLNFNGYRVVVCDSWPEAAQAICEYLNVKLTI